MRHCKIQKVQILYKSLNIQLHGGDITSASFANTFALLRLVCFHATEALQNVSFHKCNKRRIKTRSFAVYYY